MSIIIPSFQGFVKPQSALWTPINLPDLSGWYRTGNSSYVSLSGTDITSWLDQGGSNNLPGSSIAYPQWTSNLVDFQNGDCFIFSTPLADHCKVQGVVWDINWSGEYINVFHAAGASSNDAELFLGKTSGGGSNTISFDGGGASQGRYALNGNSFSNYAQGFSTSAHQSVNFGLFEYQNLQNTYKIGARYNDAYYLTGMYKELVICDATLSSTDKEKLEGYLAHQHGYTSQLPAEHPYKSSAPTV